jgi:hypothetical protein
MEIFIQMNKFNNISSKFSLSHFSEDKIFDFFSEFYEEIYTEVEDKVRFIVSELNSPSSFLPVNKKFF